MTSETLFDMAEYTDPKARKAPETEAEKEGKRRMEVQRRELKNLENKIQRGLTLSGPEQRRRQELEAALSLEQDPPLPDGVVRTAKEVGDIFGRTLRTIRYWSSQGMPRRADGYELAAVGQWALGRGLIQELPPGLKRGASQPEDPGGNDEQAGQMVISAQDRAHYETEIKRIDSEHKALKLAIAKGEYVPRDEVAKEWTGRMLEYCNGLDFLEMRLPPLLEGKTQIEMRSIIRDETRQMRERVVRTGRFCPQGAA
jgi:hypothetical protein